jgi:hypothetical protein
MCNRFPAGERTLFVLHTYNLANFGQHSYEMGVFSENQKLDSQPRRTFSYPFFLYQEPPHRHVHHNLDGEGFPAELGKRYVKA